ncbi:nucleolar complex protein 4 homolog A isoform X1 [Bactrocera dorsalis]|uniref:Nucleolar complex protein 4 homolog A isoform X1 n=1 Tax=Bactrocera dorsalis TaxID=27457 RepID=A0ABM3JQ67_BACDO|nr:nucleolar complex protein 4 homolog A isoform X1 [Bactrocera dorsalis]
MATAVGSAATLANPGAIRSQISKELRTKANDFLNSRRNANNLLDIIAHFQHCVKEKQSITAAVLTLEVVFVEVLKRREMCIAGVPLKPKDESAETKYREWLRQRYEEAMSLILSSFESEKPAEAAQALVSSMKLLAAEGKHPLDKCDEPCKFPKQRLRSILQKLVSATKSQSTLLQRFKEYSEYLDVVFYSWKLMQQLATRAAFANDVFACNYLELINVLPVTKDLHDQQKLLCITQSSGESSQPECFDYAPVKKCINKVWMCLMQWTDDIQEPVHRQMLIILLERILPHLEKPILLTDFLMDSLDCGGPVSLLALQGIFTLIQKHNITYPNIYEKLYSMFEPEIFHTKFKARLFYLADIFLSSTHLPENLVAAFVKRLARLSLIAPPQDSIIILHFIGNLILRHAGLKRLICAQAAIEGMPNLLKNFYCVYISFKLLVSRDPFIMEERDPTKSNALDSSLWEVVSLQRHAIPAVANAARFISQPLPTTEWDLSSVLELKEDDIFDQEIAKKSKQYALAFERPQSLYLPHDDKVKQYWKLF